MFFIHENLKSWLSAVQKPHTKPIRKQFLTVGDVLIYGVNLTGSVGCDLLDNVTMMKHGVVFWQPEIGILS